MKNRFRNPVLVVILSLALLMIVAYWAFNDFVKVHGQVSPQTSIPAPQQLNTHLEYFEIPVCDEVTLGDRYGLHEPELVSCDALIDWQNRVADNLVIPKVTKNIRDKRGRLIKRGNFSDLIRDGLLVPVVSTRYLNVSRVPKETRYAYPQVKEVLEKAAVEFFALRQKQLPIRSLLRFYETRTEGNSMHRRGLAVDITCLNLNQGDIDALRQILIRLRQHNARVQPAEESYVADWISRRVNKVIAYHVVVFNSSFMTIYSKPE